PAAFGIVERAALILGGAAGEAVEYAKTLHRAGAQRLVAILDVPQVGIGAERGAIEDAAADRRAAIVKLDGAAAILRAPEAQHRGWRGCLDSMDAHWRQNRQQRRRRQAPACPAPDPPEAGKQWVDLSDPHQDSPCFSYV